MQSVVLKISFLLINSRNTMMTSNHEELFTNTQDSNKLGEIHLKYVTLPSLFPTKFGQGVGLSLIHLFSSL